MSNLHSVKKACAYVGLDAEITSEVSVLLEADAAILPGVGAFGNAMENLHSLGLVEPILEFIKKGKPFLGVCLGLQLLMQESEEFGNHKGLGVIAGKVKKFPQISKQGNLIKIPQVGWNKIYKRKGKSWEKSPFKDLKNFEFMYFVHSYYVSPEDSNVVISLTNYEGFEYCSAIKKDNIFATQFHPEKSGPKGLTIYKNFVKEI